LEYSQMSHITPLSGLGGCNSRKSPAWQGPNLSNIPTPPYGVRIISEALRRNLMPPNTHTHTHSDSDQSSYHAYSFSCRDTHCCRWRGRCEQTHRAKKSTGSEYLISNGECVRRTADKWGRTGESYKTR